MGRKKPASTKSSSASTGSSISTARPTPKTPCVDFHVVHLTPTVRMVYFDMVDVYANLWQKTKLAFQYIVDEEKFDWVLKVDDDS